MVQLALSSSSVVLPSEPPSKLFVAVVEGQPPFYDVLPLVSELLGSVSPIKPVAVVPIVSAVPQPLTSSAAV